MQKKGSILEQIVFGMRGPVLLVLILITGFLGYQAADIKMDSNLRKMVPLDHEYIKNFYRHKDDLSLGNDIRIAIENKNGTIFDKDFIDVVKKVSDEAFYLEGVNKGKLKSLWTPNMRWSEAAVDGFRGGEVIPSTYDGSAESLKQVEENVLRSGELGLLVADDLRSTIVYVPLVDFNENSDDPKQKINYKVLAQELETKIRDKYQSKDVKIYIVGFAKKIGDLIEAAREVALFFVLMLGITFFLLLWDSRCIRITGVILVGAVMSVVWQLGIVSLLAKGVAQFRHSASWPDFLAKYPTLEPIQFGIDPYSMLIPFLVFAISISHGVQYTNDMALRVSKGENALDASIGTFRSLFIAGLLALVSDAFGFITLWFIDIGVIREMAITASVGVAVIVLTKLIFVPIMLSYLGVSKAAAQRQIDKQEKSAPVLFEISNWARKYEATLAVVLGAILVLAGLELKKDLKIGDLDEGAPELHADSRYNLDNHFVTENYSVSADVLVVMVETPPDQCAEFATMDMIDRFMWHMQNVQGVESTVSLVTVSKRVISGMNEGSLKWSALSNIPGVVSGTMVYMPAGFMNGDCSLVPVIVFLEDHKAETLSRVVAASESFAAAHDNDQVARFVLASGNAGVEAATNDTIKVAEFRVLLLVYGVVSLMVWIAFKSWRAMVCVVLPLMLTSILCEGLMALLGIGVKVATLPVTALGVGIGVDYGIYIYAKILHYTRLGYELQPAYYMTLKTTGRSVMFTCIALSVSVGSWIFSGIKFQADMGLLLTFMFLWNMVGALWLLPAFARLLLADKKNTSRVVRTMRTQSKKQRERTTERMVHRETPKPVVAVEPLPEIADSVDIENVYRELASTQARQLRVKESSVSRKESSVSRVADSVTSPRTTRKQLSARRAS